MAHEHSHADDPGAYYIEQLCTIGICGCLGAVSVMLYHRGILTYILHPKFHSAVLAGGITILALVVLRAIALWFEAGKLKVAHVHAHEHEHDHGHDHAHGESCDHDHGHEHHDDHGHLHVHHSHGHEHEHVHLHQHDHGHSHSHGHVHDDHGHSHGWNPWRYIVLLLPIVLYALELPNRGFSFDRISSSINAAELEAAVGFSIENAGLRIDRNSAGDRLIVVSLAKDGPAANAGLVVNDLIDGFTILTDDEGKPLDKPVVVNVKDQKPADVAAKLRGKPGSKLGVTIHRDKEDKKEIEITRKADIIPLFFTELEGAAYTASRRDRYQGKIGKIKGQFSPGPNDRMFQLIRVKVACCAADAITLNVVIVLDPSVPGSFSSIQKGQWVEVQGEIQFQKRKDRKNQDEYVTVLQLSSPSDVAPSTPELSPYLTGS